MAFPRRGKVRWQPPRRRWLPPTAAAATQDATVNATTIAAVASVPAPEIQTGSTVSPATIAAVAALPAPSVKTPPQALRAVGTNTTGTGSAVATLEVTIPTSGVGGNVAAGDLAYLFWTEVSGGLVTGLATPSGWTELLAPQAFNSSTQCIALAYKVLEAGDVGANIGFGTLSGGNRRQNISVTVYKNATHDSVTSLSSSLTGTTTPPVPGIDPTATDCLLVSFGAPQHPAANTALITSTPATGWNEQADFGTSSAASVNHGSQEVQDRQEWGGGAFSATTFTTSHSAQYGAITVALAGTVTIAPSTIATVASLPAPSISTGSTVSPATIAATAALPAPTIEAGAGVAPATIAAVASLPAPTVSAGGGATVSPATIACTATLPAPAVQTGSTVSPATVTATAALPAPSVQTGSTVSPAAIQTVAALPSPAVSGGGSASVSPATITATAAFGAVDVQTSSTVTAATIAALVALPAPSISVGSAIGVTTITVTVTIPAPVIGQAAAGVGSVSVGYASGTTPIDTNHSSSSLVTAGGRSSIS